MEQCRQFKHLLEGVKKHSDDVHLLSECFATGTIKGYVFRLFQELNVDKANGTDDKYSSYLVIKDKNANGSMWSAFYNQVDIDEWVSSNGGTNDLNLRVETENEINFDTRDIDEKPFEQQHGSY